MNSTSIAIDSPAGTPTGPRKSLANSSASDSLNQVALTVIVVSSSALLVSTKRREALSPSPTVPKSISVTLLVSVAADGGRAGAFPSATSFAAPTAGSAAESPVPPMPGTPSRGVPGERAATAHTIDEAASSAAAAPGHRSPRRPSGRSREAGNLEGSRGEV